MPKTLSARFTSCISVCRLVKTSPPWRANSATIPGSGSNGGDLGWVNPGDMVPEFDATMKDTAAGAISAPFETQFGWHILLVEDRRQTDVGAENQRNQVRNMLYGRRFEEELPIWLRKIRSKPMWKSRTVHDPASCHYRR